MRLDKRKKYYYYFFLVFLKKNISTELKLAIKSEFTPLFLIKLMLNSGLDLFNPILLHREIDSKQVSFI